MANMRAKIRFILGLLCMFVLVGGVLGQTPIIKQKLLTVGDSTLYTYQTGTLYKYCRATLYNPHDTLTDSVAIYHVSRFVDGSDRDSSYTRVGFKKLSLSGTEVQNDTVYYTAVLPAGESMEILVWLPFPEGLYWDMYNLIYDPERENWIKNTYVNE